METLIERARRWMREGKTGVPELIEEENERRRKIEYEREVTYLLEDIRRKYPMLAGREKEIIEVLHRRKVL